MVVDHHEVRVSVGAVALELLEGGSTLTADRGWTPHIQGTLVVRTPDSIATTAPGGEVTVELTQRFGDFALTRDLTEIYTGLTTAALTTAYAGDLTSDLTALITAGSWNTPVRAATGRTVKVIITDRVRTRDEHSLTVASHEVLVQDWVWYDVDGSLEGVPVTFEASTAGAYMRAIIAAHASQTNWLDSNMPLVLDRSTPTVISPTSHTLQVGDATFGGLDTFLTTTRQRLYSPGDGVLQLVDYPYDPGAEITVENAVNLIDWQITDERDKNAIVKFTGTVASPTARPIYHSGPFPELNEPPETFIDSPSKPVLLTGLIDGVTAEVSPFFAREGLDESPVKLVTINDYSVMPGSAITYTLPDEAETTDTIDAITWQLSGRYEMDIWV